MIKLFVLLVLWALAFYPVYPALVHTWLNHSNNSHGILVPFISLYLIWHKRALIREVEIRNSIAGAVILIASMGIYLVANAGNVAVVSRAMIVFSLVGLVLFNLGSSIFQTLAFPLVFLLFLVPVPDSVIALVAFPLQLFATKVSYLIIQFLSIPVYQEGNLLFFAQTQLEVAEACSGIRSLVSLTMLSLLFTYFSPLSRILKTTLLVSAIPLALLANILRVTSTGILAHFFGSGVARGFLHEFSGLAVFMFGLSLLFLEYLLLNRIGERARAADR